MRLGPVVPYSGMRDRITWPGVVLGVYSQRKRPSATMRSPLGAVNRIAKRLGRIWYSRPRVVSGVAIIVIVMIWTNSAGRIVNAWHVALRRARDGNGAGGERVGRVAEATR